MSRAEPKPSAAAEAGRDPVPPPEPVAAPPVPATPATGEGTAVPPAGSAAPDSARAAARTAPAAVPPAGSAAPDSAPAEIPSARAAVTSAEPAARTTASAARPAGVVRKVWTLGLFGSELVTVFRRWRTRALLAVLACIPLLVGIAVRVETRDGGGVGPGGPHGNGPAFIEQVSNNGLFLTFAALAVTLPFFLPMAVGVIAGDALAGEAGGGTLRYLLVAPAGRTRLLLAKYTSVMVFCLAATFVVATSATLVGFALFPVGEVTTLSGTTISLPAGLAKAALIAVLVAASLIGIAALGLFVSTLTDSGIGAMATTVGLLIIVQIVDSIPQLHAIQPYLFPHYWLSFADILRAPVSWTDIARNLGLQALYAAVFGSAAWARFTTRDVTA